MGSGSVLARKVLMLVVVNVCANKLQKEDPNKKVHTKQHYKVKQTVYGLHVKRNGQISI